jgi:hypothetical protein
MEYLYRKVDMDTPFSLGRNVYHDPRSLAFPVKAGSWGSVKHRSNAPIFDQGSLGSCTGQAMAGALSYDPFFSTLPNVKVDEDLAVKLYSRATQLDIWPGSYPPDDTGSSGLAVAKAAKEAGYISGYQHAFSLEAALTALMDGPVITGVNWYESMFDTDANGQVFISGRISGGHEICADEIDEPNALVWFRNSWGPFWGKSGRFALSIDDWGRLLSEQGDATVLTPITAPAPQPDPDGQLVLAMEPWAKQSSWARIINPGKASRARNGYVAWKNAKGL